MLPVREHKLFTTNVDNQKYVDVEIYQGESEKISDNRKLGKVHLAGLPPGKAGKVKIKLSVTIDVESMLSVKATELSTGKSAQVRVTPTGGLSEEALSDIVEQRRNEERDLETTKE
jgi:molecular chaperone DnaK (HSP70)